MTEPRHIIWYSCGAASAVMAKRVLKDHPEALVVYCETRSEHEDNERFLHDCEEWWGKNVTRLHSTRFEDTWDVWTRERYLSGVAGAPCSRALKFRVRLEFQLPTDIHYFGYTFDGNDKRRAKNFQNNHPELAIHYPLIEAKITKAGTLATLQRAGIDLPAMYLLGFHNNNCIPCPKAESPRYWARMRHFFPAQFWRIACIARKLNVRLCKIDGERAFIDDIPADHPMTDPIQPACDFACAEMEAELA